MPRMPGKTLPYVLDRMGLSAGAARRHFDAGRGTRLANRVEKKMFKGGKTLGPMDRYSETFADRHRALSISARQRQVGGRYAAGAIGLGTIGMYNGRRGNERRTPMPMTRARPGSGRNP